MTLFFNRIQRKNPRDPDGAKKWYPSLRKLGVMKEPEVAKYISDETTLNPKEAEMALYQLQKVMVMALLTGRTVQLSQLGTFMLTVTTTGADTIDEATAMNIKKVNIRFKPNKEMRHQMSKATFSKVSDLLSEQQP